MNEDRLNKILAKETIKGNFFGYLFSRIKRVENENIKTVGISYNDNNEYILNYNKKFIDEADDVDILLMLAHEGLHIMGYHLPLYLKMIKDNPEYNSLINIGMDMAVNSQLNFPYSMKLSTGEELNFHHPSDKKFPLRQNCEFYIDELIKEYNKKNKEQKNENNEKDNEINNKKKGDKNDENKNDENKNDESNSESNNEDEKNNEINNKKKGDKNNENKNDEPNSESNNEDENDDKQGENNSNLSNVSRNDGFDSSENKNNVENNETISEKNGNISDNNNSNNNRSCQNNINRNKKQNEEEGKYIKNSGTFDDHKNWNNNSNENEENFSNNSLARNLEEYTKDIVMDVAKTFTRDKGNIPGFLQKFIDDLQNPSIPYYKIIQKMVEGSKLAKTKISYSKINRKRVYAISEDEYINITPFPGKSLDKTFKIVICIDTSGSFTKDDLMESLSGIKHIIEKDKNCEITVIEIDTKIQKEYKVKRISDIDHNILGRGGTILLPALIRSKQLKADCVIFFTDGRCENLNEISTSLIPKKLIWILSHDGKSENINRTGCVVTLPKK